MTNTEKITAIETSELYAQRTLVFIETEPQSNEYSQVLLNAEQFKKMTATLGQKTKEAKDNIEEWELKLSEETYFLPDLQDIH